MDKYFEEIRERGLEPEFQCESLRLYALASQFNVLPVAGGLYDQDPALLDEWAIISNEVAKVRNQETETSTKHTSSFDKPVTRSPKSPAMNGGPEFKRVLPVRPSITRYHS